jgi:hypothetical protein
VQLVQAESQVEQLVTVPPVEKEVPLQGVHMVPVMKLLELQVRQSVAETQEAQAEGQGSQVVAVLLGE